MTTSTPAPLGTRDEQTLEAIRHLAAGNPRPVLLAGGTVVSQDPGMGDWAQADVLIGGSVIVGVGPGLLSAAGDDGMLVVDCTGTVVLPARADFTSAAGGGALVPGSPADVAVLRLADPPGTPAGAVPDRGSHLDVLVVGGAVRLFRGRPVTRDVAGQAARPGVRPTAPHGLVGAWVDETGFLVQELLPDGRYDETRGGRRHAFQGRYWVDGDRVDYLDDLGFWAYGEVRDGVLHHAGYRMTRR
ncbi:Atu4866 domain-containing protein [Modestobacter sp. SYSU DS0290]